MKKVLPLLFLGLGVIARGGTICPTSNTASSTGFAYAPDNAATGCNVVLTVTGSGTTIVVKDSTPYDIANGGDDTLIGVQNNGSTPITSLNLTGTGIFAFEQDGICNYAFTGSAYCLTNAPGGTSSTGTLGSCRSNNANGVDPYDYQGPIPGTHIELQQPRPMRQLKHAELHRYRIV